MQYENMYDIDCVCPAPPIHPHQLYFLFVKGVNGRRPLMANLHLACDIYNVKYYVYMYISVSCICCE